MVSILSCLTSCKDDNETVPGLNVISATINGYSFKTEIPEIPTNMSIEIVFGSALNKQLMEASFSLSSNGTSVPAEVSLSNANSKAIITASLEYETSYNFELASGSIGMNGEVLKETILISFITVSDEIVRSMAPCTGTTNCLRTMSLTSSNSTASFDFFANYPVFLENAIWENLTQAIIVVHGQNRDADNYYQYLTQALNSTGLADETVLISPWFKSANEALGDDLYWSTSNWRDGQNSGGGFQLSSFAVIDSLIAQLSDKAHFPELEKIIVTGHSSGGLFTHVYALANQSETAETEISYDYIVANSQYFYYPLEQRLNESNGEFYTPADCVGHDHWPLGFSNHPSYIGSISQSDLNARFAGRSLTYLLGNNTENDGSLNTSDCDAILLGSSRYQRGENIFEFMNEYFPNNDHNRVIVDGIGHDGERMYQSQPFQNLLKNLIN